MAKNKKPRKAYKARQIHSTGCFYSRADIDEVKDIINKAGLIFEIVLKTGRATELHMNLADVLVIARQIEYLMKDEQEFNDEMIRLMNVKADKKLKQIEAESK